MNNAKGSDHCHACNDFLNSKPVPDNVLSHMACAGCDGMPVEASEDAVNLTKLNRFSENQQVDILCTQPGMRLEFVGSRWCISLESTVVII